MANRAERTVFRDRRRAGWVASSVIHASVFGGTFSLLMTGPVAPKPVEAKVSVVEVEPPPPPPPPKVEPPPPPPRAAEPAPAPPKAPSAPPPPAREAPPPLMTSGETDNGSGEGFASGDNKDFGGAKVDSRAPSETGTTKPHKEPSKAAPPPSPTSKELYDEHELTVKPDIRCSAARIAALYPQTAIDNDAEADIPVEVVVDATGRITNPRAKTDPGFGLKEAAEKALLYACRPSAIPRDAQGNAVSARVVHTLHFQLE
jgi:outer membrane biosynthesis protein TonB